MTTEGAKYFTTPSGNIVCFLLSYDDARSVECTVEQKDFADAARPADCTLDWASHFILSERASYGECRGDVSGVPTDTVLGYGAKAVNGPITCTSKATGLSCANARTAHGFTISRARFRLF